MLLALHVQVLIKINAQNVMQLYLKFFKRLLVLINATLINLKIKIMYVKIASLVAKHVLTIKLITVQILVILDFFFRLHLPASHVTQAAKHVLANQMIIVQNAVQVSTNQEILLLIKSPVWLHVLSISMVINQNNLIYVQLAMNFVFDAKVPL